jgi:hypothetical protein
VPKTMRGFHFEVKNEEILDCTDDDSVTVEVELVVVDDDN